MDKLCNDPRHEPEHKAVASLSDPDIDMTKAADLWPTFGHANARRTRRLSYIAIIALAIQGAPSGRLLLSEIYKLVRDKMGLHRSHDRSWRNSIRHNLSLNECFVKVGRSDNGKGHYWAIHPACREAFAQGDFRRRQARRHVRQWDDCCRVTLNVEMTSPDNDSFATRGFVPMSSTWASADDLVARFGADAILTPEEQKHVSMSSRWESVGYVGIGSDRTTHQVSHCMMGGHRQEEGESLTPGGAHGTLDGRQDRHCIVGVNTVRSACLYQANWCRRPTNTGLWHI